MFLGRSSVSAIPTQIPQEDGITALQVICAWPVSGQYGTGTRIAYYLLVLAALYLLRGRESLCNTAIATVSVIPAIAGIHGVVLAAVHADGAVDLDVFGALQLCIVGVVARGSFGYHSVSFGGVRRISVALLCIMLAGLISLAVEFSRNPQVACDHDYDGNSMEPGSLTFPYGAAACGLTCSAQAGPSSPIRTGVTGEKYVVPSPERLTMVAGLAISVISCLFAILQETGTIHRTLGTWLKPPETNKDNILIAETTCSHSKIRTWARLLRALVELLLSLLCLLAMIIIGEINLFSPQMSYQTESFLSTGQWGPLVGIVLAVLGPAYMGLAHRDEVRVYERTYRYPSIPVSRPTLNVPSEPPVYTSPRPSLDQSYGTILELLPRSPPDAYPRPDPNLTSRPAPNSMPQLASNTAVLPSSRPKSLPSTTAVVVDLSQRRRSF